MLCLVFDADGMVLRGDSFSKTYSEERGIDLDVMLPFFQGPFRKCLTGDADLRQVLQPYLESWEWSGSVEDLIRYWLDSQQTVDADLIAYIRELRQRNVCCVLATNNERHRTEYIREQLGMNHVFDLIISSCDVRSLKPSHRFLDSLLSDIESLHPGARILAWDDTKSHVDAMKIYGLDAHLYTNLTDFKRHVERLL